MKSPLPSKTPFLAAPRSALTLALTALLACGAPPVPAEPSVEAPDSEVQPLLSARSDGLTVTLLATRPLSVGLNAVFYEIVRNGAPVTRATVAQRPVMNMTSMKHSCPLVDPPAEANAHGRFEGQLVFTMPSSEDETWDLSLEVTLPGETVPSTVTFERLAVADSRARKSVTLDGVMHVVTLTFDGQPKVGKNKYSVTVHRPETAEKMRFLPAVDLALVGTPEMPSMGHGSSGNVNPVHVRGGVYQGTVNFSMLGDWVLHLTLKGANGAALGTLDWSFML